LIRTLFVINGLGTGGAERSLAEMLPGLVERDVHPIVVCFYRRRDGVEEEVIRSGCDVRFLAAKHTFGRARALRWIIRQERPDIVHTMIFEANIAGRLAGVGSGALIVSSLVNMPYTEARRGDPNIGTTRMRIVRGVDRITARSLTTHFHAITNAVADRAVSDLGLSPERITVVERGRDQVRLGTLSAERRSAARRSLGLHDLDRVLLTAGRLDYQKGHIYLLQAMASLSQRSDRPILLVAGRDGAATEKLRDAADGLPAESVRFLGHRDDLPELLAAADVFVFPSLWEGLGGVLIEALALSIPIVASDIPPIREVVDGGAAGLLVPTMDPEAIARAVSTLLDDAALRARFATLGRRIFEERFTLQRSVEGMVRMYSNLLGRGAGVSASAEPKRSI
jgi:glycosyltransferase involved in cell wall biosynthesis